MSRLALNQYRMINLTTRRNKLKILKLYQMDNYHLMTMTPTKLFLGPSVTNLRSKNLGKLQLHECSFKSDFNPLHCGNGNFIKWTIITCTLDRVCQTGNCSCMKAKILLQNEFQPILGLETIPNTCCLFS